MMGIYRQISKKLLQKKIQVSAFLGLVMASTLASATVVAPYIDRSLYASTAFASLMDLQKQVPKFNAVTLAFGLATSDCKVSESGGLGRLILDSKLADDLKAFVTSKGTVIASFGGAETGSYFEQKCSVDQMVKGISEFLDATGIRAIDFDVEGHVVTNPLFNTVRNPAIVELQKKYPELYVSFTLPVFPGGLEQPKVELIKEAKAAGVKISVVNGMAMDYYDMSVTNLGQAALKVTESLHTQLKSIYPEITDDAKIWQMVGVTPMIGENDDHTHFTAKDAENLVKNVNSNIGFMGFWSLARDQVGTGPMYQYSQINSKNFEFLEIFLGASSEGGLPKPVPGVVKKEVVLNPKNPPSPPVLVPAPTIGCPEWKEDSTHQFAVGEMVSYKGVVYVARQAHTAWIGAGWYPDIVLALWLPKPDAKCQ